MSLTAPGRRIPGLDGIRGLAILLVVISHAGVGLLPSGGRVGVTLFFVLSGFLITRLLIAEKEEHGSINIAAFYGRRALRLLPALFAYFVGIGLLVWLRRVDVPIWDMTWPPALYLSNYAQIFGYDLYAHRHTWSLAVEEHFYLIWPLLIAAGAARRVRLLALSVVLLLAWRVVVGFLNPWWAYHGSDTNAYALALGCLIAVKEHQGTIARVPRWFVSAGVMGLLALSVLPLDISRLALAASVWLPPVGGFIAAITIVGTLQHHSLLMRSVTLKWFGLISYSLYLWHAPLLQIPGMWETGVRRLIALATAVGAAMTSWLLIEKPVLTSSWRRRLSRTTLAGKVNGMAKRKLPGTEQVALGGSSSDYEHPFDDFARTTLP